MEQCNAQAHSQQEFSDVGTELSRVRGRRSRGPTETIGTGEKASEAMHACRLTPSGPQYGEHRAFEPATWSAREADIRRKITLIRR